MTNSDLAEYACYGILIAAVIIAMSQVTWSGVKYGTLDYSSEHSFTGHPSQIAHGEYIGGVYQPVTDPFGYQICANDSACLYAAIGNEPSLARDREQLLLASRANETLTVKYICTYGYLGGREVGGMGECWILATSQPNK